MSFLSTAGKAIDLIEKGENLIDKAFYTDQEKAVIAMKMADVHIRLMETTANESTARAITRRYLACSIIGVFLFLILLSVSVWPISNKYAGYIMETVKVLVPLTASVGFFYFGYYGAVQTVKAWKGSK